MVFVEFVSPNYPHAGAKHHFVGASLDDVLADTKDGKQFSFADFSSHREITKGEASALQLEYLETGISAVQEKGCKSFLLGTPRR